MESLRRFALVAVAAVMLGTAPAAQAGLVFGFEVDGGGSPTFSYTTGGAGDTDLSNDTITADLGGTLSVTDETGAPVAGGTYAGRLRFDAAVTDAVASYNSLSGILYLNLFLSGTAVFEDAAGHALLTTQFGADAAGSASLGLIAGMPSGSPSGFVLLSPGLSGFSLDDAGLFAFGGDLAGYNALAAGAAQEFQIRVQGLRPELGGMVPVGQAQTAEGYYVSSDFTFDGSFAGLTDLDTKTTIPEPATLTLLAGGVGMMLVRRRGRGKGF